MTRTRPRTAILAIAILATLILAPGVGATAPGRNGRIAFQAQTDAGLQIFTVRANGHDLRQLTHVDGDATGPDWSPDGRRIAFSSDLSGESRLYVMDRDGSHQRLNYKESHEDPSTTGTSDDPLVEVDHVALTALAALGR